MANATNVFFPPPCLDERRSESGSGPRENTRQYLSADRVSSSTHSHIQKALLTKKTLFTYLLVGSLSLATGFALYWLIERTWLAHGQTTQSPSSTSDLISGGTLGARRPDFVLPDLNGKDQEVGQWDGKVVLVNFWATWCPPCRREIPEFVKIREKYAEQGFEVVGIAIEENREAVREFARETGVNYPLLIGTQPAVEVAQSYGNRLVALPYSAMFDRQGTIRFMRPGELSGETLEIELKKLL